MLIVEFHEGTRYGRNGCIHCLKEKDCNPPGDTSFHPMPRVTSKWREVSYEYYVVGEEIIRGKIKYYYPNGAIALLKEICENIETKGGK